MTSSTRLRSPSVGFLLLLGAFYVAAAPDDATAPCHPMVDLVFVIDTSGSVKGVYDAQRQLAAEIVDLLPGIDPAQGARVAAIQYSGFPIVEFTLDRYSSKSAVLAHLRAMQYRSGVTRTGSALVSTEHILFSNTSARPNGAETLKRIVVLMTDGVSLDDSVTIARELRRRGVEFFVASLADDGYLPELIDTAGAPAQLYVREDIEKLKNDIFKMFYTAVKENSWCSTTNRRETTTIEVPSTTTAKIEETTTTRATTTTVPETTTTTEPTTTTTTPEPTTTTTTPEPTTTTTTPEPTTTTTTTTTPEPTTTTTTPTTTTTTTTTKTTTTTEKSTEATTLPNVVLSTSYVVTVAETTVEPERPATTTKRRHSSSRENAGRRRGHHGGFKISVETNFNDPSNDTANDVDEEGERKSNATHLLNKFLDRRGAKEPAEADGDSEEPEEAARAESKDGAIYFKNRKRCSMDILFLVDSSGSLRQYFSAEKSYVKSIIQQIEIGGKSGHRVALIQFAGPRLQRTEFGFDAYRTNAEIIDALDQLQYATGTTALGKTLESAKVLLDSRKTSPTTPNDAIVVLLTDGYSQDDAVPVAYPLVHKMGVPIYAVGLPKLNNRHYLEQVTGGSKFVFIGQDEAEEFGRHLVQLLSCRTES